MIQARYGETFRSLSTLLLKIYHIIFFIWVGRRYSFVKIGKKNQTSRKIFLKKNYHKWTWVYYVSKCTQFWIFFKTLFQTLLLSIVRDLLWTKVLSVINGMEGSKCSVACGQSQALCGRKTRISRSDISDQDFESWMHQQEQRNTLKFTYHHASAGYMVVVLITRWH